MKLNFLQSIKSIGRPRFLTGLFLTGVLLGGTVLATRWIPPVSFRSDPTLGVTVKEETSKSGEVEGISIDSPTSTPPPTPVKSKQIPSLTSTPTSNPMPTKQPIQVGILEIQPTIHYVLVPIYQSPSQTSTYNKTYWDEQIKQAEKEAEESRKAKEIYDQQCAELIAQRNVALAPIQDQMNEVLAEMDRQRAEIDSRTDLSEAGKSVAKAKISGFDEWMDLQAEYNRVYAQYGSC